MKLVRIENKERRLNLPLQVKYCESFLCRLRGLMFRSKLGLEQGIVLVQPEDSQINSAIHMLFVFMDLAVIWINSDMEVVDSVLARAWRPIYLPRRPARYILEIHPYRLNDFQVGDRVEFCD